MTSKATGLVSETLRSWDPLLSTLCATVLCLQNLSTLSQLGRAKYDQPHGLLSLSSPSLQLWGLFSSSQVHFGEFQPCYVLGSVEAEEAYGQHKITKTYKWVISTRIRSMAERSGLSWAACFAWMYLTNLGEKWWVLGKGRGEKDVAGSKCPCFVALGGLSESQRLVLQARPIKYQFGPRLMVQNEPHSCCVTLY